MQVGEGPRQVMDVGVTQEQTHRGRTVILQDGAETLTIRSKASSQVDGASVPSA